MQGATKINALEANEIRKGRNFQCSYALNMTPNRHMNCRCQIQCTETIRLATQLIRKSADTWQMTMTI